MAAWSYFYRYQGTPQEYELYRNAGLTMVQAPTNQYNSVPKDLDILAGTALRLYESQAMLEAVVREVNESDRNVIGYVLADEPWPHLFPDLTRTMEYIYDNDRVGALPIIDMFPDWAVLPKRFGMTYEQYMKKFMEEICPPMLLNCMYPLICDGDKVVVRPTMFSLMEMYRDMSLEYDIGLMGFAMVTAYHGYNFEPTESELRFQVFSHLAYGAKGIWFWNYRIGDTRYGEGMIKHGRHGIHFEPSSSYPIVKKVATEIGTYGAILLSLRSVAVRHTGPDRPDGVTMYQDGDFEGITFLQADDFVVGSFVNMDDTLDHDIYVFATNKRHSHDPDAEGLEADFCFRVSDVVHGVSEYQPTAPADTPKPLSPGPDGFYRVTIAGGDGRLLRLSIKDRGH
jgi:hypothetical protein